MAFNRSKRPRLGLGLGLGLGLPIASFGTYATLRLHFYMLPHEVVTSPNQRVFRHISVLRGVLRVRIGWYTSPETLTCEVPSNGVVEISLQSNRRCPEIRSEH